MKHEHALQIGIFIIYWSDTIRHYMRDAIKRIKIIEKNIVTWDEGKVYFWIAGASSVGSRTPAVTNIFDVCVSVCDTLQSIAP